LLSDPDSEESRRVMKAMLQMKKIEVEALQRASADRA
jgi:predicted 3-demethylubiquinone-9 3-methyltransferase (glyoxalase superfamily)